MLPVYFVQYVEIQTTFEIGLKGIKLILLSLTLDIIYTKVGSIYQPYVLLMGLQKVG